MSIFERIFQVSIFGGVWKQVQQYLFSEKRWLQLLTLKPIELYTTTTQLDIDGATVELQIKSYIENIVQKRIKNVKSYIKLDFMSWSPLRQSYQFKIIIKARTTYNDIAQFFNFHFANRRYEIEPNKYAITIKEFKIKNQGTKAAIEVPFIIHTNRWFLKKEYHETAFFTCSLLFNNNTYTIKTRNLRYDIKSNSLLIKWIDNWYHHQLINFLDSFLVHNYREEIFLAKLHAQEQLNDFQVDRRWIHGTITDLNLERITIDEDAIRAVFVAEGNLEVN